MDPALSLERFAAVSAEIDAGMPRDKVLAREGIPLETWTTAQEAWLVKLADEVTANRFDLTSRYNAAFMKRRQALDDLAAGGEKKAAPKRSEPLAPRASAPKTPGSERPAPDASPPIRPADPAPTPVALPSFLIAPAAAPHGEDRSAPPLPQALLVAPPAIVEPPVHGGQHPGEAQPARPELGQTLPTPRRSPWAAAASAPSEGASTGLPFMAAAAGTPPAARVEERPPAAPARRPRGSTVAFQRIETEPGQPSVIPKPGADLPFRKPGAASGTSGSSAPPPAGPEPNATVIGQMSPFATAAALPFRDTPGAKALESERPGVPAPAGGLPFQIPPAARAPLVSQPTPAPLSVQPPSGETRLTLEQLASLAAEISQNPAAIEQVRARYHLSEAAHFAESSAWQRRFAADQTLFARYTSLFQTYRDWLARPRR